MDWKEGDYERKLSKAVNFKGRYFNQKVSSIILYLLEAKLFLFHPKVHVQFHRAYPCQLWSIKFFALNPGSNVWMQILPSECQKLGRYCTEIMLCLTLLQSSLASDCLNSTTKLGYDHSVGLQIRKICSFHRLLKHHLQPLRLFTSLL